MPSSKKNHPKERASDKPLGYRHHAYTMNGVQVYYVVKAYGSGRKYWARVET